MPSGPLKLRGAVQKNGRKAGGWVTNESIVKVDNNNNKNLIWVTKKCEAVQ